MRLRTATATLAACVLLASCKASPSPEPGPTPPTSGWTWLSPHPQGANLGAIWAASPSSYYAVGFGGTILHITPAGMTVMTPTNRANLRGVWGTSDSNVYAVGDDGTIIHKDGDSWSPVVVPGVTTDPFYSIWGSSAHDVWVGGAMGAVRHFDGTAWQLESTGEESDVVAIWGPASGEVFAATMNGRLYRRSQGAWSVVASTPTRATLFTSMWGSSATDIYLGSQNPVDTGAGVYHFDGSGLTKCGQGTPLGDNEIPIFAVWGSGPSDVFVAGTQSNVWHFDGTSWAFMIGAARLDLFGLYGTSSGDAYAVGEVGAIYHFNGVAWDWRRSDDFQPFRSIWGASPSDLFLGSLPDVTGNILFHWDGTSLEAVSLPAPGRQTSSIHLWGSAADNVFAVGGGGERISDTEFEFWGTVYRFDGSAWAIQADGLLDLPTAIWGSSATQVFVGFRNGSIHAWDGASWRPMTSPTSGPILSLHGSAPNDVYAVGPLGLILHHDGTRWEAIDVSALTGYGMSFVHAFSSSDVWAGGRLGTLLHYDGRTWSKVMALDGSPIDLNDAWGISGGDFYIAASSGDLFHSDGTAFTNVGPATNASLATITGFPDGSVYTAGSFGTFLKYQR